MAAVTKRLQLGDLAQVSEATSLRARILAYKTFARSVILALNGEPEPLPVGGSGGSGGFGGSGSDPGGGAFTPPPPPVSVDPNLETGQTCETGLQPGMGVYQAGMIWKKSNPTVAGAWVQGIIETVSGTSCAVRVDGIHDGVRVSGAVNRGQTLWPDAVVPGVMSATRPDPLVALFIQEVAYALRDSAGGTVRAKCSFRIEPRT